MGCHKYYMQWYTINLIFPLHVIESYFMTSYITKQYNVNKMFILEFKIMLIDILW